MEKVWLKHYPPGVPADIDPGLYRAIPDMLAAVVSRHGSKTAFSGLGGELTYSELEQQAGWFAAYLQNKLSLTPGGRVALMMPNVLAYPLCLHGVLRAGGVVVNCNPLYTPDELKHQLKDSGATVIVILENFAHVLAEVQASTAVKHVITVRLGDLLPCWRGVLTNMVAKHVKKMVPPYSVMGEVRLPTVLSAGKRMNLQPVKLEPESPAFLQYTGGTTGVAKGAVLTHRNIVANALQSAAWISPYVVEGDEVIITALPLYHVFSLLANCFVYGLLGAENVLVVNPRDIPGLIKTLRAHPFTAITGVNTLFAAMLRNPEFRSLDFSRLRIALGGGAAVQRKVAEDWQRATGKPLVEAYGLTEASPAVCINRIDSVEYSGAIGYPLPSTELELRNDDNQVVALGERGEICIRGPQVMQGYWQRPDETANVLGADGFLRTGDVGVMEPDGLVRIVDRKKEMILVSGFNVYPSEVEAAAALHPEVREVAAVGIPNDKTGESVRLYVVSNSDALDAATLIAHCREHLTGYKVPHQIEFRDDLPKSPVGKILRRALRDEALSKPSRARSAS